jgi:hypothetical protein
MTSIKNEKISKYGFLKDMYEDGYFPNHLVDKIKEILIDVCKNIESKSPKTDEELFSITHKAVEQINELEEEFEENESELETAARESMGADFEFIVRAYGFLDVDIEDVIAPREW